MPRLRNVHPVWRPSCPELLARCVSAWRQRSADVSHMSLIVAKGCTSARDRAPGKRLLAGVEHEPLVWEKPVRDVPAYRDDNRTRRFGPFDAPDPAVKTRVYADTWNPDPTASARARERPASVAAS